MSGKGLSRGVDNLCQGVRSINVGDRRLETDIHVELFNELFLVSAFEPRPTTEASKRTLVHPARSKRLDSTALGICRFEIIHLGH